MLVLNDRPLKGEFHVMKEGLGVGAEISVRVAGRECLLGFVDPSLFFLALHLFSVVQYLYV